MVASRSPGPLGTSGASENLADGTMIRALSPPPGSIGGLTGAEQDLLLDLTQMALDLAGIIDPTPVSDGASMTFSLGRGDYSSAAISAVSMVPLVGDLAKSAKLGRYISTLEKAAGTAARSAVFRVQLLPLARKLATVLEEVRVVLPGSAQIHVDEVLSKLEKVLGGRRLLPLRGAPQIERIALQLLEVALKHGKGERPIALYFGFKQFPPPVPPHYMTVDRLIEWAPGGREFLEYVNPKAGKVSYRDIEQMWLLLSERVAEAASAQGRVDVFVTPQWFNRMFPSSAVPASIADKEFVTGAIHRHSGRYLDEAFNKIESLSLRDVQFIAVTDGGKEVARQRHRL